MEEIDLTIPPFLRRPKPDRSEPAESLLASIKEKPKKLTEAEENEILVRKIAERRWREWSARRPEIIDGRTTLKRPRLSTYVRLVRAELAAKEKAWAERRAA